MSDRGEKTKVAMSKGSFVSVESPDVQSFLGKLLLANGWVLPDDLELALKQPSEKKLGLRLIDENFISPHAVFEVMEEQMALRLAKVIQDQNYVINFESKPVEIDGPSIDPEEFYLLLDDWICSRVSGDWLQNQFALWQDYSLRLGPSHDRNRREYSTNAIKAVKDIISSIENIGILSSLHQAHVPVLVDFYKAFYYMLCLRFVLFAEKVNQMSEAERVARLQKIWTQMKNLNLIEVFQMIGGRKDMDPSEVTALYSDFTKRNLGATPHSGANAAFKSVYEAVRLRVGEAYDLFLDPQKLQFYERELEAGKVNQRSVAQVKADEAKKFLSVRQYASAIVLLNKATELYPKLDNLVLYRVWGKVGLLPISKQKPKDIIEIDQLLAQVPSEEKITAVGNFVQGLVSKAKGETAAARKFFESALAIDKNLIEARRELNSTPSEAKKSVDILHGDLSQVIGNLFKKS
jgi:tetratricopeptide (TPR) repeat protein